MALTYVPVILNNAPELTVTQLNTTTITNSGAINTATLATTGNVTVGGTLTVTGTTALNAGLSVSGGDTSLGTVHAGTTDATQLTVNAVQATTDAIIVKTTGDTQPQLVINGNGRLEAGSGSAAPDVAIFRNGSAQWQTINDFVAEGNLICTVAGKGVQVKEGANAKMGTATLITGSTTVSTTAVTANSRIFLTVQQIGTVSQPKAMTIASKTAGTSFQIVSSDATDTSTVAWMIVEPA